MPIVAPGRPEHQTQIVILKDHAESVLEQIKQIHSEIQMQIDILSGAEPREQNSSSDKTISSGEMGTIHELFKEMVSTLDDIRRYFM